MVAAKQSRSELELKRPMVGLSISYDGKPRVESSAHEQALEDAYRRGYDEASSQYNEQIVEFRAEVNALREGTFSQLENRFGTILEEAREALMSLTYQSVVRALGGFEMTQDSVAKIVNAIIEESGLDEEKMQIRLHPLDIELLEKIEPKLKAAHGGLEFVPDDTLHRGDCLLSSRFGKVDGLMSTKLDRLRESLRPSS